MPVLTVGSWLGDGFIEAFQWLMEWCVEKAEALFGFEFEELNPAPLLEFATKYVAWGNEFLPLTQCFTIVLTAWGVRIGILSVRYILGWVPAIEG